MMYVVQTVGVLRRDIRPVACLTRMLSADRAAIGTGNSGQGMGSNAQALWQVSRNQMFAPTARRGAE